MELTEVDSVFVTGGAGLVGSKLIEKLANKGVKVRSFDNFSGNAHPYISHRNVEYIRGDVRNYEELVRVAAGSETFFHLAASGNVIDSIQSPMENLDNNVIGTVNALRAASENKFKQFIFSSTGGALMGNAKPPVDENSLPSPLSPYGASKLACEGYCSAFYESFGLHTTIFRFANVIGEYSAHKKGVVNSFFHKLMADEALPIFGAPTRDFIYVGDLVDGLLAAINREIAAGEIFHLCSGRETSVLELAKAMSKKMGKPNARIIEHPARIGEVERTFASSEKARQLLGFECTTDILTALDTTVGWLKKHYTK